MTVTPLVQLQTFLHSSARALYDITIKKRHATITVTSQSPEAFAKGDGEVPRLREKVMLNIKASLPSLSSSSAGSRHLPVPKRLRAGRQGREDLSLEIRITSPAKRDFTVHYTNPPVHYLCVAGPESFTQFCTVLLNK